MNPLNTGAGIQKHSDDLPPLAGALREAMCAVDRLVARRLAMAEISYQQARALYHIELLGANSAGRLTNALALGNSATRLIDALEERGWLRRQRDVGDRRVVNISLTDRGKQQLAFVIPIAANTWREMLAVLPVGDEARLVHGLRCISGMASKLVADMVDN